MRWLTGDPAQIDFLLKETKPDLLPGRSSRAEFARVKLKSIVEYSEECGYNRLTGQKNHYRVVDQELRETPLCDECAGPHFLLPEPVFLCAEVSRDQNG